MLNVLLRQHVSAFALGHHQIFLDLKRQHTPRKHDVISHAYWAAPHQTH